ncbi:hypothetical protein SAMN06269117_11430 [Balnearium lithotrophicum]|uniref:Uncharacterized protein n=1 Tax=Balnearium lithotrophicum TaxID=223788 RepID=A0A521CNV0_9BACT|nr:hypothetical protein [Balnearium lithotrophicum]SMO61134.1 hypothetical protein SAMN06269117_11430 [Balnearium lithotrophicum]
MKVVLPIYKFTEPPFTQDKYIKIIENGVEKEFFCRVVQPTDFNKAFTYILPDGFPKSLAKVIFGPEAIIDGGKGNEDKESLSVRRNKRGRKAGKKTTLAGKSEREIILSL